MKSLKDFIVTIFDESEIERVDYYIEKIRESLITTNKLFITYNALLVLSVICFYLFSSGFLKEIELFGQKISDFALIRRWFLIIPSALFCITSFIAYLRVYQKECIEWLIARHRNKEYKSDIFRLTLPSDFILGMDILRRQDNKWINTITFIPILIIPLSIVMLPIIYVYLAYAQIFVDFPNDLQTILSFIISNIFIMSGLVVMGLTQKI